MKKEVIFNGKNNEVIKVLEENSIRLFSMDDIREFIIGERTIYVHFDNADDSEVLQESDIQQLLWAKQRKITTICISSNLNTTKTKALYQLGFNLVMKEDPKMEDLLKFVKNRSEMAPAYLYGKSQAFNKAITSIYKSLIDSRGPLLILGQTGVGKTHTIREMVKSINPNKVFISKNLSELSPQLIESELFGHVKGAFTGALNDRKGLFEQANGGVIFLDEIATIPLQTQQKILKVIEEKTITPVGSNSCIKLDFQLVTATCESLKDLVKNKVFREDLYYRLAISSVEIPSISQRAEELEDILFTIQKSSDLQVSFCDEAIQILKKNKWRGNYRDLHSLIEELKSEKTYFVTPEKLPSRFKERSSSSENNLLTNQQEEYIKAKGLPELIKQLEVECFKKTFKNLSGRTNKICDDLKISKSVYYRISQAT